jgi:hypothetical protein
MSLGYRNSGLVAWVGLVINGLGSLVLVVSG